MSKRNLIAPLLVVLLVITFGCSHHPNDETIVKDIQQKVATDPDTKDANVTVSSKDGHVTLQGKATAPAARQKAEQIAKAEPGVADVDDEIAVEQAAMPAAPEAAPAPEPAAAPPVAPPPPKPKPQPIVIPAGTVIAAKLTQGLSSKTAQTGDSFDATLAEPVVVRGKTVIPSGSSVTGKVLDAKSKGKIKGEARLQIAAVGITVHGKQYPIETSMAAMTEKGKGKRTAATTGGGAAGGALIGGLAGGGKGAGIGALVGAGAGFVGGALTGNKQIELPAESQVNFKLTTPLTLPPPSEVE